MQMLAPAAVVFNPKCALSVCPAGSRSKREEAGEFSLLTCEKIHSEAGKQTASCSCNVVSMLAG